MSEDLAVINTKRKILWEPPPVEVPISPNPSPDVVATVSEEIKVFVESKRKYKRVGNGHKSEKTRDLFDFERDLIRNDLFLPKNGMIEVDDCVAFRIERIHDPAGNSTFNAIAIFQVTGYVSVLHTYVAEGRLMLKDICAYEEWMCTKYGKLWARYNHPLYVTARMANKKAVAQGQEPTAKAGHFAQHTKDLTYEPPLAGVPEETANEIASSVATVNLTPTFVAFKKRHAEA
jgi:hypothetical protein